MTINIAFPITLSLLGSIGIIGFIAYVLREPDKSEKAICLISRLLKFISTKAERTYVKFSVQSTINGYINKVHKDVPGLSVTNIKLEWIDENMTAEQFINTDTLVLRMRKSRNPNRNIVNATVAFVSTAILIKAKYYLAKYQKTAVDLFTTSKILSGEKPEVLGEFVDCYLREAMDNKKVNNLYGYFEHIDKAGLFFPILINELNFLGEKVFANSVNKTAIYEEVNGLIGFLNNYSRRKLSEDIVCEYNGTHCHFAIRIVGKGYKIEKNGAKIYVNNIKKISNLSDTIYLIGNEKRKQFIDDVVSESLNQIDFVKYNSKTFEAVLKDSDENEHITPTYLVILRNKKVAIFHEK